MTLMHFREDVQQNYSRPTKLVHSTLLLDRLCNGSQEIQTVFIIRMTARFKWVRDLVVRWTELVEHDDEYEKHSGRYDIPVQTLILKKGVRFPFEDAVATCWWQSCYIFEYSWHWRRPEQIFPILYPICKFKFTWLKLFGKSRRNTSVTKTEKSVGRDHTLSSF